MSEPVSPCQSCGACCASFRVDFHPAELAGGAFAWDGGPALVAETSATTLVPPGAEASVDAFGNIVIATGAA